MDRNIQHSVAFSGHRHIPASEIDRLRRQLRSAILRLYDAGCVDYICGMAVGFDLLSAEAVLELRGEGKKLRLTAAIPCPEQSRFYNASDKARYDRVLSEADRIVTVSKSYYRGCMLRRNDYLVANAGRLIAYYDGSHRGGTAYTVSRAKAAGRLVTNLYGVADKSQFRK
ncbi:MAG: SLOG family protein [Muribaculaceae bacterium]